MKDRLEDFIHQHREAFDDREPSPRVWERVENSLRGSRRSWKDPVVLWRAAAIFFMVLSGYLLLPGEPAKADQSLALKEFTDVEAFYFQQISNKVDMIREFQESEGLNGFTHDFQQLEAMYLVLKEEMKVRPSQKVKDALVLNLLVRIDLLNQQLHRLEEREEEDGGEEERST